MSNIKAKYFTKVINIKEPNKRKYFKTLINSYDEYYFMIDDYKQMVASRSNNEMIIKEIDNYLQGVENENSIY